MAVIREKIQFRNQKIGVTRVSTGQEQLWNTVSQAADTLTARAFQSAEIQARKAGKEVAENMSDKRLRTIDPATGQPIAYQAPAGFGTVAQAAFEETLDRRYIRSIEQEIRDKANETYLKYVNDPQGPEKYAVDMEDYVGQMTKNANSRFQNMVRDTGAAYIASTKLNLLTKRQQTIVEQEQGALTRDNQFVVETIQSIAKGAGSDLMDANSIPRKHIQAVIDEQINALNTAVDANIFTDEQRRSRIRDIQAALPISILQSVVNADASFEIASEDESQDSKNIAMNVDVASDIESSLSAGRVLSDVPESLRPYVQEILDSDSYKENPDPIIRKATELRVDLANDVETTRKKTQLELSVDGINKGHAKTNTDKVNRNAADVVVANDVPSLRGLENPDMTGFMMSEQSLTKDNKTHPTVLKLVQKDGLIPQSLLDGFTKAFNLDAMKDEQLKVMVQHWENLSSINVNGKNKNALLVQGGITQEQNAFFQTISYLTKTRGPQGIVDFAISLKENRDDPDRNNANLRRVFGSINEKETDGNKLVDEYLMTKFPNDYNMRAIAKPLVQYLASSRVSFDEINDQVNSSFEVNYLETDGLVIDRHNPDQDRSMFALSKILDEKEQRIFMRVVNQQLKEHFGEGKYLFSKEDKPDYVKAQMVKLVPITQNSFEPDQIPVTLNLKDGTTRDTVIESYRYMVAVVKEDGTLDFLHDKEKGPLIVSTHDAKDEVVLSRQMALQTQVTESKEKAANITAAEESRAFYEDAF
jgi:hypothetical protein